MTYFTTESEACEVAHKLMEREIDEDDLEWDRE